MDTFSKMDGLRSYKLLKKSKISNPFKLLSRLILIKSAKISCKQLTSSMKWKGVSKTWTKSIYAWRWSGPLVTIAIKMNNHKLLEKSTKSFFNPKRCLSWVCKQDIRHFTYSLKLSYIIVQKNNKHFGNGFSHK